MDAKMPLNYHCLGCDLIYSQEHNAWIPKQVYKQMSLPIPSSSYYHPQCVELYVLQWLDVLDEADVIKMRDAAKSRLEEILAERGGGKDDL